MAPLDRFRSRWLDVIAAFDSVDLLPLAPQIATGAEVSAPIDSVFAAVVLGGAERLKSMQFDHPGCDWSNVIEGIDTVISRWAKDPLAHEPRHVGYLIGVAEFLQGMGYGRGLGCSDPVHICIPLAWAATVVGPHARDAVRRALLDAPPVALDDEPFDRCLVLAIAEWLSDAPESSRSFALLGAASCLRLGIRSSYSAPYLALLARDATPEIAELFRQYQEELLKKPWTSSPEDRSE
ncbi:MAG: hypothetical protein U0625_09825 [Phycisphaerales bacterium]